MEPIAMEISGETQRQDNLQSTLSDLSLAEDEVCELMNIAQLTCSELERVPNSDPEVLKALSSKYIDTIKHIRQLMMKHVKLIDLKSESSATANCESHQKQLDTINDLLNELNYKM